MSDVPRPFKTEFEGYKEAEERFEAWLAEKFSYGFPYDPIVRKHDMRCLVTEMRDMMVGKDYLNMDTEPYKEVIEPWSPKVSKDTFLNIFNFLS